MIGGKRSYLIGLTNIVLEQISIFQSNKLRHKEGLKIVLILDLTIQNEPFLIHCVVP